MFIKFKVMHAGFSFFFNMSKVYTEITSFTSILLSDFFKCLAIKTFYCKRIRYASRENVMGQRVSKLCGLTKMMGFKYNFVGRD